MKGLYRAQQELTINIKYSENIHLCEKCNMANLNFSCHILDQYS